MNFSTSEVQLMQDTHFLLTKAGIIQKMTEMFAGIQDRLRKEASRLPVDGIPLMGGKISRGENYRQLPYLILDYPADFSRDSIFAFRTMFWWGHFFSATLHLQGDYLSHFRDRIKQEYDQLLGQGIYYGVGKTPWEYHYGSDNYEPLSEIHRPLIDTSGFLKFSRQFPLNDWQKIPEKVVEFYCLLLPVLSPGHR